MKKAQIICLLLVLAMISAEFLVSCSDPQKKPSETSPTVTEETAGETEDDGLYHDGLPDMSYDDADYIIYTYENINMIFPTMCEEQSADILEAAMYKAVLNLEDRFDINLKEITVEDDERKFMTPISAGEYAYDIGNARCTTALLCWEEDYIYTFDELAYVDLDKPYWFKSANESLSINNIQYVAIGGYSVAAYSLVHPLLFNKDIVEDVQIDVNPYQQVENGTWTLDAMKVMMAKAVKDLNGDNYMSAEDRYGYLSHYKEVLPSFWISCGELSVAKDSEDAPYLNIESEGFINVFNRIYELTHDSGAYFKGNETIGSEDIPLYAVEMFSAGQSLFMDTTFFAINRLSNATANFGIVPYPKYDENQSQYYSRIEYYNANMIPVTVQDPERAGLILEALNCEYANTVIPAYYNVVLQRKKTRDDESIEMLDIIFDTLTVDIGDTTLCGKIRDGFLAGMFKANVRDLASYAARISSSVNKEFENLPY